MAVDMPPINPAHGANTTMDAFKTKPALQEYQAVESLASDWPETRAKLLDYLRDPGEWTARESKVDIFLYTETNGINERSRLVPMKKKDSHWLP